jgi:hypothetical protein
VSKEKEHSHIQHTMGNIQFRIKHKDGEYYVKGVSDTPGVKFTSTAHPTRKEAIRATEKSFTRYTKRIIDDDHFEFVFHDEQRECTE